MRAVPTPTWTAKPPLGATDQARAERRGRKAGRGNWREAGPKKAGAAALPRQEQLPIPLCALTSLAARFSGFFRAEFMGRALGMGSLAALAPRFSGFFGAELMGGALGVSSLATLAGNFLLFVGIHGCKATIL